MSQDVMVNLLHQSQQSADLAFGKTFSRKPVQVISRQISQQLALVLAKWHGHGHKFLQVIGVHGTSLTESFFS